MLVVSVIAGLLVGQVNRCGVCGVGVGVGGAILSAFIASAIKVANQWERAIVLRLRKFRGTRGPGLVEEIVDKQAGEWGLDVTAIRLQQIGMSEELKKIMSRQAAAEREKRATITKAEGDRLAAENLAAAAATMASSPGAMQLRTLQTVDGLGPSASNTVVLAVPIEIMELVKRVSYSVRRNGKAALVDSAR